MSDLLWLRLHDQSLFFTGGTGLFGRWIVASMCDANRRLGVNIKATILTRDIAGFMAHAPIFYHDDAITLMQGDVVDFDFPAGKFSKIFHMATTSAQETFRGEDQLAKFHMLVNGTERVLQFAAACEAEKVLFTSSGVVYGAFPATLQRVPETYLGAPDTTNPLSALGQAKRVSEFLCGYYADQYQFDYTVARCFSFIGVGLPLNLHYAIGNLIGDAIAGNALTIRGDGSPVRSYLYQDDLIVWLLTLLLDGEGGRIYNVGSDVEICIKDLADLIRNVLNQDLDVNIMNVDDGGIGNFSRSHYVPDVSRARSELCLDVWTPLETAIIKTSGALFQSQGK